MAKNIAKNTTKNYFGSGGSLLSALLVLIFFLNACAVGPDYIKPETATPENYSADCSGVTCNEVADTTWWKTFQEPLLDSLILQGVADNKDVGQSLARINQSRALADRAFSELLPGAQLASKYEKGKSSGARFPGGGENFDYEVYTASVDALWELDIFGRLRRELESRNAEYDSSVALLQDTVRMVVAEIGTSYLDLRGSQADLKIAKKNRDTQRKTLKLVKTKYQYGQVGELDVARAETQLAQTKATIPSIKARVKAHVHRLAVLVGKQPQELYPVLLKVRDVPTYNGPVSIDSPSELLRRRPDIRSAERQLAAANARIGVAVGELFPKVTINGSVGWEAPKVSDFGADAYTYNFGPRITWAAFDSGRLRAQVRVEDARTEEALLGYEKTVLLALEDVENSLTNFTSEKRRLVELEVAKNSSRRAYELADDQYREGLIEFIDVLDAQRAMLFAEREWNLSKAGVGTALIGVYKALGGGWEAWELVEDNDDKAELEKTNSDSNAPAGASSS